MSLLSDQQQLVIAEGSKYLNSCLNYSDLIWEIQLLINGRMLGASGVIYGLLAAWYVISKPGYLHDYTPIPLKAKYFVLILEQ